MQKSAMRILSIFLAVVALSLLALPAQVVANEYVSKDSFWNWAAGSNGIAQKVLGYTVGKVCLRSSDSYHHATSYVRSGKDGDFLCICQYCGDHFIAYAEDIERSYKDSVAALPAPSFNSDGHMIWHPTVNDVLRVSYSGVMGPSPELYDMENLPGFVEPLNKGNGFYFNGIFGAPSSIVTAKYGILFQCEFAAPITGDYKLLSATRAVGEITFVIESSSGTFVDGGKVSCYDNYGEAPSFVHLEAGSKVWTPSTRYFTDYVVGKMPRNFTYNWYLPVFEIVTGSMSDEYDKYYNVDTRPSSITGGNYGIVGDNGQITKVENNSSIVNETNNTYYNPATGQTEKITGWSYDYSDRSYKVTLESGDTVSVTYGDENITIQEGDTVYNVYYLVDGNGGTQVDPPAVCEHTWADTSTVAATCTRPGSKLSTCSKCQQTKTETLPALGHDWRVKQTVTTQYDETGQLVRQGYTIFECSRCHEQYKSSDGAIPPGGGSGTDPGEEDGTTIGGLIEKLLNGLGSFAGGIIKGLLSLLTKAVEALGGLAELFTAFVGSLADLWGGYTSFLSAVFPFLPEEFVIIIELGLILVVAAAVFRKFLS